MDKIKVLFLCIHNSARSQIAEAYMKKIGGSRFAPESAGLEAGKLNPLAIEVMQEDNIDISNNSTKDVFDLSKQGKSFSYIITVCDAKSSDRCPIFPGVHEKINWGFEDPAKFTGNHEERIAQMRIVRDKIKNAVKEFILGVK